MTPIYATVLANPDPVQWTASAEGRYIGIGSPTQGVDVDTLAPIPTPIEGLLSGDGQSVVAFCTPTQIVRVDVASGAVEPLPAMPFGWTFDDVDGTSSDGRTVVAEWFTAAGNQASSCTAAGPPNGAGSASPAAVPRASSELLRGGDERWWHDVRIRGLRRDDDAAGLGRHRKRSHARQHAGRLASPATPKASRST